MHISLRAGEKFYINGAVLRVDRKVSIELLNDATFLLEAHVMHVGDVTTPLRQLYFIVQIMLMNPADTPAAREMFAEALATNRENFGDPADFGRARQCRASRRRKPEIRCIEGNSRFAADRSRAPRDRQIDAPEPGGLRRRCHDSESNPTSSATSTSSSSSSSATTRRLRRRSITISFCSCWSRSCRTRIRRARRIRPNI